MVLLIGQDLFHKTPDAEHVVCSLCLMFLRSLGC